MRDIKDILKAWKNTRALNQIGTEYPFSSGFVTLTGLDFRKHLNEEGTS